jgi:hypothetical protein
MCGIHLVFSWVRIVIDFCLIERFHVPFSGVKNRVMSGLPGQILEKVATKGKCDEKFLKKVACLGALIFKHFSN